MCQRGARARQSVPHWVPFAPPRWPGILSTGGAVRYCPNLTYTSLAAFPPGAKLGHYPLFSCGCGRWWCKPKPIWLARPACTRWSLANMPLTADARVQAATGEGITLGRQRAYSPSWSGPYRQRPFVQPLDPVDDLLAIQPSRLATGQHNRSASFWVISSCVCSMPHLPLSNASSL
jgi:hypothetical protein